ncbi:MAG TPA: DUF6644 family protein [Steroidobacteraceae bacterium]
MDEKSAIQAFCQWLYDTSFAAAVRESEYLFPWVESFHVLALAVVVGSIAVVDLRLLGLASRNRPVSQLMREVLPVTWIAFVIAVITGVTLFSSNAVEYWSNTPFRLKLLFLALAGVNMMIFHLVTYRSVAGWDDKPHTPAAAKMAGAVSLALWVGVVAFGRWIGFTIGL